LRRLNLEPELELEPEPPRPPPGAGLDAAILAVGGGSVRQLAAELMAAKSTVRRRLTALQRAGRMRHDGREWLPV